jgi:ABC-type multidrug transport system permease subunit
VVGGLCITLFSMFCGFTIKPSLYPDFWVFMYWTNPLHYALEGLVVTQFNRDHTLVAITGTDSVMTAQSFVQFFYEDWDFSTRGYDILALCLFALFNRYGILLTGILL